MAFGMKMHMGVDADSGLAHSVVCTAANEADVAHAHELLHGQETAVGADSAYIGLHSARRSRRLSATARCARTSSGTSP